MKICVRGICQFTRNESGIPFLRSFWLLDQIRTIDKQRLGRRLGALSRASMLKTDRAIRLSLAV